MPLVTISFLTALTGDSSRVCVGDDMLSVQDGGVVVTVAPDPTGIVTYKNFVLMLQKTRLSNWLSQCELSQDRL